MKSKFLILSSLFALGATLPLSAQDEVKFNVPSGAAQPTQAQQQQFSDAQLLEMFGWFLGRRAGLPELEFSPQEVASIVKGLQSASRNEDAPYDLQAIGPAMDRFMNEKQTKFMEKLRQAGMAESQSFLTEIRKKDGVVSTPSGLAYEIVQPGTGAKPKLSDTVRVHYTGTLVNGTVFDSSRESDQPAEFELGRVIPGWSEGIQQIAAGGKIKLYVPPHLAYGDEGAGGIPPAATLIFDVELLEVKPGAAPAAK
jgi:FKBP-type peptidyl-prolyl cis-trans isomerase